MSAPAEDALPRPIQAFLRPETALLALVAAGLGYRVWRAWQDIPTLVRQVTADDAYYYFQIARNISNGHNITFDGETLTNGFHPLWLALITPVYFITDDVELGVHLSLTVGAVLGALTIAVIYLIGRELTDNGWAALVGAAFFAIHPYIVVESVNGMETATTQFMLSLTTWLFVRLARNGTPTRRDFALLGLAIGLMLLARTDTVFVAATIGVFLLVKAARAHSLDGPALTAVIALISVTPWLLWNLVTFGTLVQVSGVAIPDYQRQIFLFEHGDSFRAQFDQSWTVIKETLLDQLIHRYFVYPLAAQRTAFVAGSIAAIAVLLAAPLWPQRRAATSQLGLLAVPAIGVLLMLLFHSAIRWHVREWYYGPVPITAGLLITVLAAYLHSLVTDGTKVGWSDVSQRRSLTVPQERRWLPLLGVYGLFAAIILTFYGPARSDKWVDLNALPHRENMLIGADWLRDNTNEDARIGALNSGILGYFSDRRVFNLDGVVNEDAYRARLACRTSEYVVRERIGILADVELAGAFAGLDSIDTLACGRQPCLMFERRAKVGRVLGYFDGGQIDILEVTPFRRPDCPGG